MRAYFMREKTAATDWVLSGGFPFRLAWSEAAAHFRIGTTALIQVFVLWISTGRFAAGEHSGANRYPEAGS
jgi:hypothetical protein